MSEEHRVEHREVVYWSDRYGGPGRRPVVQDVRVPDVCGRFAGRLLEELARGRSVPALVAVGTNLRPPTRDELQREGAQLVTLAFEMAEEFERQLAARGRFLPVPPRPGEGAPEGERR